MSIYSDFKLCPQLLPKQACLVLERYNHGKMERIVHEHFLFTIVAAAVADDEVAVWAIGDGAYTIAGRDLIACPPRVLGPFADNQPPYLGYDLLAAGHGDAVGGRARCATTGRDQTPRRHRGRRRGGPPRPIGRARDRFAGDA